MKKATAQPKEQPILTTRAAEWIKTMLGTNLSNEAINERNDKNSQNDSLKDFADTATAAQPNTVLLVDETRMDELNKLLNAAKIVTPKEQNNVAAPGSGIKLVGVGVSKRIYLSGCKMPCTRGYLPKGIEVFSTEDPLGAVLLGKKLHEEFTFLGKRFIIQELESPEKIETELFSTVLI